MRKRLVARIFAAPIVACLALAAPVGASAHARTATVALDYRLVLDSATRRLPGVSVAIFDGDRDLHVAVRNTTLVILGDLGEPMLRIGPRGAWANRASATAVAERLAKPGRGWAAVASGPAFTWHEHRLSPPPYEAGSLGTVARFELPATLDGQPVAIGGSFVRYARPLLLFWLGGTALAAVLAAVLLRLRPRLRRPATVALGAGAGLAALTGLVTFQAADAPDGRVAWLQLGLGVAVGVVVYTALWRVRGLRRAQFAGLLGAAAGAVSLGSLGVFWHGVVISLLPGTVSRTLCAIALAGGATAAVTSYHLQAAR